MSDLPVIPLDLALDVAMELCERRKVTLTKPSSARREAVVYALAATHALSGDGWDLDAAREHVSVTLPGAGASLDLLSAIPYVGPLLRGAAEGLDRTQIYLAPSALRDGPTLLGVVAHELGHADQIERGGLVWCAAYGLVPEARAGAESPCYGQDVTARVLLEGVPVGLAVDAARRSLESYGLDADALALAHGVLDVYGRTLLAGGLPGGPILDVLQALRARRVSGLPVLP